MFYTTAFGKFQSKGRIFQNHNPTDLEKFLNWKKTWKFRVMDLKISMVSKRLKYGSIEYSGTKEKDRKGNSKIRIEQWRRQRRRKSKDWFGRRMQKK